MITPEQMLVVHELREQGVSWPEIEKLVSGCTENDRKLYNGWRMMASYMGQADDIEEATSLQALKKARKILTVERSVNNNQITDIVKKELFDDQLKEAILNGRRPLYRVKKKVLKESEKAHIFTISDYHYDGDIEKLNIDFDLIEQKILTEVRNNNLNHIYLVELGDLVDGATLRTSQLLKIKKGIVSQIIESSKRYMQLIENLLEYVNVTFIILESSNHSQLRNLGTKQNEIAEEDMMRVFSEFIKLAFKNEKDFQLISGYDVMLKILDFNFFFGHGHLIKSNDYIAKLQAERNILIDYSFFGHFHHAKQIDLNSAGTHDKIQFFVPSCDREQSTYERDRNLSAMPGIGYYQFEKENGYIGTKKLLIK